MVRSHCLRLAVYKLMSPCNAKALQRGFTSHIKPKRTTKTGRDS